MIENASLYNGLGKSVVDKVIGVLKNAGIEEFGRFVDLIRNSQRIFVVGAGRSGLVGRFFAMRLMHIGKTVYIAGDTITPSIMAGDLLIAISGSGKTPTVNDVARNARKARAVVASFSQKGREYNELFFLSDLQIQLERRHNTLQRAFFDNNKLRTKAPNVAPMGTVFEVGCLIYLELVVGEIICRDNIQEVEMQTRHANLE